MGMELAELAGSEEAGSAPPQLGITAMDYSERTQLLALVLSDGSVAMCKASACGLSVLPEMVFSHWVCEPEEQAVCVAIGAEMQLLAVGTVAGEVLLYRCGGGGEAGVCVQLAAGGGAALCVGLARQRRIIVSHHAADVMPMLHSTCSPHTSPAILLQADASHQRGRAQPWHCRQLPACARPGTGGLGTQGQPDGASQCAGMEPRLLRPGSGLPAPGRGGVVPFWLPSHVLAEADAGAAERAVRPGAGPVSGLLCCSGQAEQQQQQRGHHHS